MSSREYPKVWDRFERTVDGGTMKFVVEDVSEAMWSTAVEFMLGNYIKEDVWWSTAGTARDPDAVQEYRVLLTSIIRQKMSLACFLADGDGTGHTLPKTEAGLLSLRMFAEAMKVPVIYDKYGVGEYLMGAGLSVAPEYRRLGIATKLLTARIALSKSLGFRATGGIFTSEHGQQAAEKANYECLYTVPYKKFGKRCNIIFNSSTQDLKIYAIKTE
ncbi:uncharacterized protein LOC133533770 isoform X2 [Cydia pomonella]|uniref:uncharacterized protein LOC133533770 isoform X2 n=1 Tax=Cydia pomonella TaxID=82600 RepID=UPI002ADDC3F8|nr:uncharacterized protein LOC133533770 isoform X2 [Cydia pomonella]